MVRIALDITANLVETTPVDTGWARANWVPTLDNPFDGNPDPEEGPTAREVADGRATQQEAIVGVKRGYRLAKGVVYITNNVPYIRDLNDGSSKQAPAGFVQTAVQRAVQRALT